MAKASKSIQQLEYCRLVLKHEGGKALIITPLGVRQEFVRDAVELLGMPTPQYITCRQEALDAPDGSVLLTNYERVREGDIEPLDFTACCLDEASVLRSFGSKTYQSFLDKFKGVRFKLVATATPDPNRYKELIHYAGFLEVMDTGQALTRFFQRDSTKANNLTLYPHKEEEFWLWISTWSFFLSSPADLGLDATGYNLPPLDVRYHKIETPRAVTVRKDGQMQLFEDAAEGLAQAAKEKRDSIPLRVEKMKEIVESDPQAHFLLWHDLEEERGRVCHDSCGVGVYKHYFVALLLERKTCLRARIVEFRSLTYYYRSGANDQDLLQISSLCHIYLHFSSTHLL